MQSESPTILCIDDDSETLALRRHFLQSSGYQCLPASSAVDGLRTLSDGAGVDLVLLDYMMPGMNGDEVAQKLKGQYPELPVLSCLPLPVASTFIDRDRWLCAKGPGSGCPSWHRF